MGSRREGGTVSSPIPPRAFARPVRAIAWTVLAAGVAACEGATAPRFAPPVLRMTIPDSLVSPRQSTEITINLTPTANDPVVESWVIIEGGGERDSLALPFNSTTDPQAAYLDLTVPPVPISVTLQLRCVAVSRSRQRGIATGVVSIGDTTPPSARWVYVDDTVLAGQTAYVGAEFTDASGIAREELHLSGAIVRDDVYDQTDYPTIADIAYQITVPAQPGDSIVQWAIVYDMYGLSREIRQVYYIKAAPIAGP